MMLTFAAVGVAAVNPNRHGLRAQSIDNVLRMRDSEIDIATAALILSREWGAQHTTLVYRNRIDRMAEAIRDRLAEKRLPLDYRAIPTINAYLFDEMGFSSVEDASNPEDVFLHKVLENRRGYCLSLSVLYLSITERLGLPVYGVVVPGHFFVRYDDGTHRFNIETTSGGGTADDQHYIEKFSPPDCPRSLYMKNLTPKQTLGCLFNNLGNSYLAVDETEKGFEVLLRAVQINPLLSEANINLGSVYLKKQMPQQAIALYEQAAAITGEDAKLLNNLASAHMQLENYRKAESLFRSAMRMDPEYAPPYSNMARLLHAQGSHAQALTQLKTAMRLDPQDAENFVLAGQISREMRDFAQAERNLLTALRMAPSHAHARIVLGFVYLDQDRTDIAIDYFQAALANGGANSQAYFGLAQAYGRQERTENEIWAYTQVLLLDPHLTAAYQNLGIAYLKNENTAAAVEVYQQALAIEPQNAGIRYNLAVALARQELHDAAINEFLRVIELEPANAMAYNGAAISYYQAGDKRMAKAYAQKAKSLGYEVQAALLK